MAVRKGSEFRVTLGGLKLPAAAEKRIATEIRRIVMREVAKSDLKGDLIARPGIKFGPWIWGLKMDRRPL